MKNKKFLIAVIAIIAVICILFIIMMSRNKTSDISVKIEAVEETDEVEGLNAFGDDTYLKATLSITNKSNKPVAYISSKLTSPSGQDINEDTFVRNASDDMLKELDLIKENETLTGCVYFKTTYEDKMQLKTKILTNMTTNGSSLDGETQEYLIDIKK